MSTATMTDAPKIHDPGEETAEERAAREAAERKAKADQQLHARILELDPKADVSLETVAEWNDDQRAAVAELLNDPPASLDDIPLVAVNALGEGDAQALAFAATRRKLDLAMKRDDRVRKAERRLAKEQRELKRIDDEIDELKEDRKGQDAKVKAAVSTFQAAVKDQASGQNALPLGESEAVSFPEPTDAERREHDRPSDPAAVADIDALELSDAIKQAFRDAGKTTVEQVRAWVQSPPSGREKVAGVGPVKVQLVADALNAWVNALPAPADG